MNENIFYELYAQYVRTKRIFKKSFVLRTYEFGIGDVEKVVKVIAVLDGPERDPRDYCIVTGLQSYEVDMPLEEFFNTLKLRLGKKQKTLLKVGILIG